MPAILTPAQMAAAAERGAVQLRERVGNLTIKSQVQALLTDIVAAAQGVKTITDPGADATPTPLTLDEIEYALATIEDTAAALAAGIAAARAAVNANIDDAARNVAG